MVRFTSDVRQKIKNSDSDETLKVAFSIAPEFHSRSQETADEIINDYDIDEYDKIVSYSVGTMDIYCEVTVSSLEQILQVSDKEDKEENRIKEIFIPRR